MLRFKMPKAVTAYRMKQIDELAIRSYGIPSIILMENAGRAVAEAAAKRAVLSRKKRRRPSVLIFCGKGNNGGDGMVSARYLFNMGITPIVNLIGLISDLKGDPATHAKILRRMGISITEIKDSRSIDRLKTGHSASIIVDALFGTGFTGQARGLYREAIEVINSKKAYKFSVDVPSGLDATKGLTEGSCIKADETLTMGFSKTGFYKNDGPGYTGKVRVIDIGLPRQIRG